VRSLGEYRVEEFASSARVPALGGCWPGPVKVSPPVPATRRGGAAGSRRSGATAPIRHHGARLLPMLVSPCCSLRTCPLSGTNTGLRDRDARSARERPMARDRRDGRRVETRWDSRVRFVTPASAIASPGLVGPAGRREIIQRLRRATGLPTRVGAAQVASTPASRAAHFLCRRVRFRSCRCRSRSGRRPSAGSGGR
jgi:hypothetical protein